MAKTLRWNDLKIGLLFAGAVVAAAGGVLIFGRVGSLRGKTLRIFVTTDAARGVIRGTEVWLDGQKVGLVRAISFQPPTVSVNDRVVIALDVLSAAETQLRRDSQVQIRPGATLIGDEVVYLSSGTSKAAPVADGDTIHSTQQVDYEAASDEATEAMKQLPPIIANVKLLGAQLKSVNGTLGALGVDQGMPEMRRVRARATLLLAKLSDSTGTIGLAMNGRDPLTARATHAMAEADSIRALMASNDHSLGRFRRDTTIKAEIARLQAELSEVERLAASPNGTIGRFRTDSAITRGIQRDRAALDSIMADMKKHPLRYNPF